MKRIERNTYNSIKRNTTADTINVEIPVEYSHEARQAIHEYLTINGMRVTGINWNSIQECYCIHWEPARTETAEAIRRQQENADIDDVTNGMDYSDWTWNGYRKPAQQPQEAPQEAPAAEAEQQPTTTDEAPQAATQAAQEATTEPAPVGVWMDDGSATDSQTAREMIQQNIEYLEPDDPARAEQIELLAELDRQEGRPAQEPKKTTEPAGRIYHVYFTDNPYQAMTVKARTKREAEKAGRLYIRQWQLDATIDRIERDEGEAIPF